MNRTLKLSAILYCTALAIQIAPCQAHPPADALKENFQNPPKESAPRVWWHWMNGNISQEGIKLDLDWMSRVGIGGFTVFEGSLDTPQVVPHRLIYMTPEWKAAFQAAITHAHQLGFEVSIAGSPGWSETGGPWVQPSEAMKKMVWSSTRVRGGQPIDLRLPAPPDVAGTFQDYAATGRRVKQADGSETSQPLPHFYRDSAVVAYRLPEDDLPQAELAPHITVSSGTVDAAALSDGSVATLASEVSGAIPDQEAWIQFDYGKSVTIRAVTLAATDDIASIFADNPDNPRPHLDASEDGINFRRLADIPTISIPEQTVAIDAASARYFRLTFPARQENSQPVKHHITELVLSPSARVNQFEARSGFATVKNYDSIHDPSIPQAEVTPVSSVVDLTSSMSPDGNLHWTPPSIGSWMILRIGYSLTGHENGPAPAEGTGLEVDKFNSKFVQHYVSSYLDTYSQTIGADRMGKPGIGYMLTDSIEVGSQNWTDSILDEFHTRRGYDAHPWLPVLTGAVIGSSEESNRFLWDFRNTIAELIAQNHYGTIASEVHRRGLGIYGEALEFRRPTLGDDLAMRSRTDIPMGAMWTFPEDGNPNPSYVADLLGAASIAHIYGQNLVAAESLTSAGPAWGFSPRTLKRTADLELALGVNRFMIHESTHQPLIGKAPGLTLGPFGQWFNRNDTWAEMAKPWVDYLSRASYLLQQGHFSGDVAYFYGQEGPLTAAAGWNKLDNLPQAYGYDFVNADILLHELSVKDGRITTRTGMSYRVLVLGGTSRRMTLPVLLRLREMATQGATILGPRPSDSPSLSDDQNKFQQVADQLWGTDSQSVSPHPVGKGVVYSGLNVNEVLAHLNVKPDFEYDHPEADTSLVFLHRQLPNADLYFISNRKNRAEEIKTQFRVAGKVPELWDAATGAVHPVSYTTQQDRTTIQLHLDPDGSIFVVFRNKATSTSKQLAPTHETVLAEANPALNSDWKISFAPDRGAPATAEFKTLTSWSENSDAGIRYYSGTSTYTKTVSASASWFKPHQQLFLDLGSVREIAEVSVNGKSIGTLWKTPFRLDVTAALKPGENTIEIKVANLWVNRLIGDQQPGTTIKYTYADITPYSATSPLVSSGLLGPIHLVSDSEPASQEK